MCFMPMLCFSAHYHHWYWVRYLIFRWYMSLDLYGCIKKLIQETRALSIKKLKIFLIHVEIFCLKKAAHAVILNENLKEFIFSKTNKPFKNTIINNAVNTSLIEKLKANNAQKKKKKLCLDTLAPLQPMRA